MTHTLRSWSARRVVVSLLVVGLVGCGTGSQTTQSGLTTSPAGSQPATQNAPASAAAPSSTTSATPSAAAASPAPSTSTAAGAAATGPMAKVTIYKADDQCINFLPQEVEVPGDRPIEGAVGKVLEGQGQGEFDLSGYRVSVDPTTREAVVDLRMAAGEDRQIVSLSACEQFALFGSLRETLTKNPEWNIKSVRFTERGQEIVL